MKYFKAVDLIQWVWKKVFDIEYSKSKIRQDLKQGAVRLNDRKIKEDDIFVFEDDEIPKC